MLTSIYNLYFLRVVHDFEIKMIITNNLVMINKIEKINHKK